MFISNEIKKIASIFHINYYEVDSENIFKKIIEKYTNSKKDRTWLWEDFSDDYSVYDADSYKLISNFILNKSFLVLIKDEKIGFGFDNVTSFIKIYEELEYLDEFYITDEKLSYLICKNHHDYLICCGIAKKWLINYSR